MTTLVQCHADSPLHHNEALSLVRIKYLVQWVTSGSRGWAEYYSDAGPVFIRMGNLDRNSIDLRLDDIQRVAPPVGAETARTCAHADDILISVTAYIGTIGVVPSGLGEAYVNQHTALVRPKRERVCSRWLAYCLHSRFGQEQFRELVQGGTKEGIGLDDVQNLCVPRLLLCKQQATAAFLDRKTAQIDQLIAKKQRLIELLQEKRQALISQAVTKGLDPNVKMKDSGIEWLGKIPAHWSAKRLRYITPQVCVGIVVTPAKYYVDEGIPCLRSLNVRENCLVEDDLVFISKDSNRLLSKSMIFKDDLVAVRTGQPGTTAVVDDRFHGTNCIDLIVIRKSTQFESQFLSYVMNSQFAKSQFGAGSDGAIQQHFNIETATNLLIPLPPLDEQKRITCYLTQQTAYLATLVGKNEQHIEKLHEYRQTLISAAVTGKIDVTKEVA